MRRTLPGRWMLPTVAALCLACGGAHSQSGDFAAAPMPGSSGCPRGAPPSNEAELEACLRSIRFDTDTLAGDEQPLSVVEQAGTPCPGDRTRNCRYGPLARIEPVIGAHEYTERELREGRIIARISVGPKEKEGYPKFGLSPGAVTYWWVQKDASGTSGRSVYVTLTNAARVTAVERKLEVHSHLYRIQATRALARWIWDPQDEKTEGSCGSAGSCR